MKTRFQRHCSRNDRGAAFLDITLLILLVSILSVTSLNAIAPEVMERFCYASNGLFEGENIALGQSAYGTASYQSAIELEDPPLFESWDGIGCVSSRLFSPSRGQEFGEGFTSREVNYINFYSFTVDQ